MNEKSKRLHDAFVKLRKQILDSHSDTPHDWITFLMVFWSVTQPGDGLTFDQIQAMMEDEFNRGNSNG